jgi:arylsulfatase A-like enzyme
MKHLAAVVFSTLILLPAAAAVQNQPQTRPNIIFIMSDDHAAHAIGAYGSRVNKTPHIDRLASEGALLTNVFATKESIRMPFLVRWPVGIKPGTRSDALALNVDFAPMFLDIAGVAAPAEMQGAHPAAGPSRSDSGRLARGDVLPLLSRPRRPQYEGALRRPHPHAQVDLLLEEGPVGAVRPGQRSQMNFTTCTGSPDRTH